MSRRLRAAGYPPDWPEIARAVKERAGWRCERCDVAHGAWVSRGRGGQIHVHDPEQMRAKGHGKPPFWLRLSLGGRVKVVEVVLQACHLDGVPSNCQDANLRCWCQHCHLAYDLAQHVRNAASTRRAKMGTGEMFAMVSDPAPVQARELLPPQAARRSARPDQLALRLSRPRYRPTGPVYVARKSALTHWCCWTGLNCRPLPYQNIAPV